MSPRPATLTVFALALLIGAGLGGYALGHDRAPDRGDAEEELQAAHERASAATESTARSRTVPRGSKAGRTEGLRSGLLRGRERGSRAGTREVEEQRAAIAQAAEVERQRLEAQQEEAEQEALVPCLLGDGLCTPAENQERIERESYCGGYDPSRVQPDGSYLPKPGC